MRYDIYEPLHIIYELDHDMFHEIFDSRFVKRTDATATAFFWVSMIGSLLACTYKPNWTLQSLSKSNLRCVTILRGDTAQRHLAGPVQRL